MRSGALLDDGNGAAHSPQRFEIAQQDDSVGQIGDVDRGLHVAHQPVLRDRQEGRGALPVQILQQFMHMQNERVFLRHGGLIAVQAVDDDGPHPMSFHAVAHALGKFAG